MSPKNLISIKQIRQDELSGYALTVTSGFVVSYVDAVSGAQLEYVDAVSGALQDQLDDLVDEQGTLLLSFRVPIASGVDLVHCGYAASTTSRVSVGSIGTSGANDPLLVGCFRDVNATGTLLELSAATTSPNYYLNLLVPA